MQKLVFTNGNGLEIDLTSGNFGITNWAGLSNTSLNIQTQQVPFEDGGVFLDALMEQREIELTVAIYDGNNLGLRYQKKRELIFALNPKAGEGVLVYTNDYLTRQIKAVPQLPIFENKNSNDSGTLKASVVFSCPSPYWEDVEETSVELTAGVSTAIQNNGDVPVSVKIDIETNRVKGFCITNQEAREKIKIEQTLTNNIEINTGVGKKTVYEKYRRYFLQLGFVPVISYKDDDFVLLGGNGISAIDSYGVRSSETTSDISIKSIKKINGEYYTVGNVYKTSDGYRWENVKTQDSTNAQDIENIGNKWLDAYSEGGRSFATITIGNEHYTHQFIYESDFNLILVKGDTFYLYCSVSPECYSTVDGHDYTHHDTNITVSNYLKIDDGVYVTTVNKSVYKTTDCLNWTEIYTDSEDLGYISKNGDTYLMPAGNKLLQSSDLIHWQTVGTISTTVKAGYVIDGIYRIVDVNGEVYKKDRSSNWVSEKVGTTYITDILYDDGYYILTNETGIIITQDMINWKKALTVENQVESITKINDLYIAGASNGILYTSTDLESWTTIETDSSQDILEVLYNPIRNEYLCVCVNGVLKGSDLNNLTYIETVITNNTLVAIKDGVYYCIRYNDTGISTTTDFVNFNKVYNSISGKMYNYNGNIICATNNLLYIFTDFENPKTFAIENWFDVYIDNATLYAVGSEYLWILENDVMTSSYIEPATRVCKGRELMFSYYARVYTISTLLSDINKIYLISGDSNMNFNLINGINTLYYDCLYGSATVKVSYRQKYIGV